MENKKKWIFLFPGQGAQYPTMGKDFIEHFDVARQTFEEGDEILGRHLSKTILGGPDKVLTETIHSQPAIFITSVAILRVLEASFPQLIPFATGGLSLGEYTALFAAKKISFVKALDLVQVRAEFMTACCKKYQGGMKAILGLTQEEVVAFVKEVNLPHDLWVANLNAPSQAVIAGSLKGLERGEKIAKEKGAKKVISLNVEGAFHSGLMKEAEEELAPYIEAAPFEESEIACYMNVTGKKSTTLEETKKGLIRQVSSSVLWENEVKNMAEENGDNVAFLEFGPGKTLSALYKRMNLAPPLFSLEKMEDLEALHTYLSKE